MENIEVTRLITDRFRIALDYISLGIADLSLEYNDEVAKNAAK